MQVLRQVFDKRLQREGLRLPVGICLHPGEGHGKFFLARRLQDFCSQAGIFIDLLLIPGTNTLEGVEGFTASRRIPGRNCWFFLMRKRLRRSLFRRESCLVEMLQREILPRRGDSLSVLYLCLYLC